MHVKTYGCLAHRARNPMKTSGICPPSPPPIGSSPPLSSGCLAGVTRALVIEICKKLGIPVFEDNTELEFLEKVEFAFLTSTLREVQAIETVNGVMLPLVSSPIIKKIKCEFDRISTSDQDP